MRSTDRNIVNDERNKVEVTFEPTLSAHSIGTSTMRKPARFNDHEQIHIEREVGDAQRSNEFFPRLRNASYLHGHCVSLDVQPEKQFRRWNENPG